MNVSIRAAASAVAMLAATPGLGQALVAQNPTAVFAPSNESVLRVGTEVSLKMSEELTTKGKNLRVGQRFRLEVAEPVSVGGNIVIPTGSPAVGEVTEIRNKGMWGKSGNINARILYVQVDGRQIRLSGSLNDKGKTGTGGVVASVALIPLAGFFVTGTSALVPMGSFVKAFIDEDVPVAFATATPAPMVVAAPMVVPAPTVVLVPTVVPASAPLALQPVKGN